MTDRVFPVVPLQLAMSEPISEVFPAFSRWRAPWSPLAALGWGSVRATVSRPLVGRTSSYQCWTLAGKR